MDKYHTPVMLNECIEGLNIKPEGTYVDVTFGGGGHSRELLKHLGEDGKLLAFDQDADAKQNVIDDERFVFIDQNFRYMKNFCRLHEAIPVDGILADLGVSSYQFDQAERGFSIRFDAGLDMRMNQQSSLTAKDVVNTYSEADLHRIFGIYGEIQNAKSLANTIVTSRLNAPIVTVADLKNAISNRIPKGKENKYLAQVFQALRIEVNQELEALKDFLIQSADVLVSGGRLVVMSYHSLEDRLVKNFIAKGKFSGEVEKDFYGNDNKPFDAVSRGAITASDEEVKNNNRARSAKLRIAVKKMTNRLRTPVEEEEEVEKELIVEEKPVKEIPDNFFTQFFNKGFFNAEAATRALPFILFLSLLGMIYIANRNFAEKNIRDIDKITKEVKELSYDYKTTKAELAYKSTLTEVGKRADTLGIKESLQPPQKITDEEVKNDH